MRRAYRLNECLVVSKILQDGGAAHPVAINAVRDKLEQLDKRFNLGVLVSFQIPLISFVLG